MLKKKKDVITSFHFLNKFIKISYCCQITWWYFGYLYILTVFIKFQVFLYIYLSKLLILNLCNFCLYSLMYMNICLFHFHLHVIMILSWLLHVVYRSLSKSNYVTFGQVNQQMIIIGGSRHGELSRDISMFSFGEA